MRAHLTNIARLALMVSLIIAINYDWSLWWVLGVPWVILCLAGIILTIPFFLVIGLAAGAAQADWMSDSFIIMLAFVTPTGLSIFAHSAYKRFVSRNPKDESSGATSDKV